MHIFYKPEIKGDEIVLNEEESKHCVKVLRLKAQDIVYLIDGVGGLCKARIVEANPGKCKVIVYQQYNSYGKRSYHISIAIAPTKNIERFEWFLEKATEIGIDRIIPTICHQSERKIIKPERLNKILIEAIKQSKQAYLPVLENITEISSVFDLDFQGKKFIAYCAEDARTNLKDALNPGENALILIGPEGDFTEKEIESARKNGYQGISLGKTRLRTETAGIVACQTVSLINQV